MRLVRSLTIVGVLLAAALAAPAGAVAGVFGRAPLAAPALAGTLPAGFTETTVWSGLGNPTVIRFAADGRVFVASKSGIVNVFDNLNDTTPTQFVDLRSKVHDYWDRGLLGMALDPGFTTGRPYVYVLYAYDKAPDSTQQPRWGDGCPTPPGPTADGCVVTGRLSRISTTGAETVLIEDWCQQYPSHSIGTLDFGPDGMLYVSAGDGASFNWADYGQDGSPVNPCGDPPSATLTPPTAQGGALRAQSFRRPTSQTASLDGAILRVNPDTGAAAAGNPAIGNADPNRRRIVAHGFRNPFRFTFRPGTGEIWAGDVGWNTWEEIDRVPDASQVRNYGWPCYEGTPRMGSYDALNLDNCETLYAQGTGAVQAPYFAYNHNEKIVANETCTTGSSSISGLAFYTADAFPAAYKNALFFADYSRNCIWVAYPGANGLPDMATRQTFLAGAAGPVFLTQGPDGALYYADLAGGTVRRIAANNSAPTARIVATPTSGLAPLTVAFDGTTSSDPDGQALTYAWDLDGDGDYDDSTAAKPSFTYPSAGTVTVRLRVTDTVGSTGTTSTTITVGAPPTVTIATPTNATTWAVGDTISFSGSARNSAGATLPAASLRWALDMRHCSRTDATNCHTHHIQDFVGVASGSFVAPDHEYPSHLELSLIATDAAGLTATQTVQLNPRTADLTLTTVPAGLQLSLASDTLAAPFTRTVIARSATTVAAPTPQGAFSFASWSDGGGSTHTITAPASGTATYTATFTDTTADVPLAGTEAIGTNTSSAAAGHGEVYRITASRTGPARSLRLYLDASSRASKVVLGLYADAGGEAGALLGTGTIAAPTAGAWNSAALNAPVNLVNGTAYWFALLNPADSTGQLAWRDRAGGSGGLERTSAGTTLTALPATWAIGGRYSDGPVSGAAYGSATPLPPVLAVAPAAVTLASSQGAVSQPLTVSNAGDGALAFTVSDDAAWLSASPASGTAPATVTLTADPAGLSPGTYNATVTLVGASQTKTVPVTFSVVAPSSGLVGAWGFDETAGATTADASGNGNTGTLNGPARTSAGRFGSALDFDGVNDWVTVADSASLRVTTGMTLEGWAYPTGGSGWRTLALKETASDLAWALYPFGDGGLPSGHMATSGDLWARGTAAPALNTWTHFAVTYDGATIRMYVNGVQTGTRAQIGTLRASTQPLRFGGNAIWPEWFRGRLDEIRVYDRPLSAVQIQADMAKAVSTATLARKVATASVKKPPRRTGARIKHYRGRFTHHGKWLHP
ncbi:PQQ-dependent sugar dehydrogenase [Solirubrobacter soli]|uniref:PQQ-dependent sugar dehydrogenase n=1 Tax=Solirubrobacter soli TaxID=363832 RepID=UPI000405FD80|nr:LamG-like jellyroll fold domain-containing protein [Solirubrobacter soli]